MTLHWPQITLMVIYTVALGLSLALHGKKKEGTHNFGLALLTYVLIGLLLYKGGFFTQCQQ